jgi:hypothetical protein
VISETLYPLRSVHTARPLLPQSGSTVLHLSHDEMVVLGLTRARGAVRVRSEGGGSDERTGSGRWHGGGGVTVAGGRWVGEEGRVT